MFKVSAEDPIQFSRCDCVVSRLQIPPDSVSLNLIAADSGGFWRAIIPTELPRFEPILADCGGFWRTL
jgi:hypothetical protein